MDPINPFDVQDGGKTAGWMSYFFVIGWSLAYFGYHQNNKTSLSSFHLRQSLLLFTTYLTIRFGLSLFLARMWLFHGVFLLGYLNWVLDSLFIIFWFIGLAGAINGEKKPIPLLGNLAQTMFPNI